MRHNGTPCKLLGAGPSHEKLALAQTLVQMMPHVDGMDLCAERLVEREPALYPSCWDSGSGSTLHGPVSAAPRGKGNPDNWPAVKQHSPARVPAWVDLAHDLARQPARRRCHLGAITKPEHHLRVVVPADGEAKPRAQVG